MTENGQRLPVQKLPRHPERTLLASAEYGQTTLADSTGCDITLIRQTDLSDTAQVFASVLVQEASSSIHHLGAFSSSFSLRYGTHSRLVNWQALGSKKGSQLASIGVVFGVRKDNGSLYVQKLLPGGSAEQSGAIQVHDVLLVRLDVNS